MKLDRGTIRGSRQELISELEDAVEGWEHQGKPTLAEQAAAAAVALSWSEVWSVRVGHVVYLVDE